MLFHLSKFGMNRWLREKAADGGAGAGTGEKEKIEDKTEDSSGEDKEKSKSEEKEGEVKVFSQSQVDAIIADRLAREKKASEKAAEAAKKKAEEEALTKNAEWKTLAETRGADLEAVTKERDELLAIKEQAETYKAALDGQVKALKKDLPKHILPLVEEMDPVKALEYLSKHGKELGVKAASYPETPEDEEKKAITKEDEVRGKRANSQVITSSF